MYILYIYGARHEQAQTCILDGEILAWNRATSRWLPFGNNISVALKEGGVLSGGRHTNDSRDKALRDAELKDSNLCLILFDVLLIGDERLEQQPLQERRKRLQTLIDADKLKDKKYDKVLEIVSHTVAQTEQHVKDELEQAMTRDDEEGLMLKSPDSFYRANMRDKSGWYKLKPEYVENGTQDYDVIIIGGSYGKNNRSGCMWTWICGLAVKPPVGQKYPAEFLSFCRIGTGLKHHQNRDLDKLMRPMKLDFDVKKYKKGDRKTDPKTGVTIERCERGISVTYPRERINGETLPAVTVWFSGSAQEEVEVVFDPRKSVVLKLTADYRLNEGDVWMSGRKGEDKRGWYLRPAILYAPLRLSPPLFEASCSVMRYAWGGTGASQASVVYRDGRLRAVPYLQYLFACFPMGSDVSRAAIRE